MSDDNLELDRSSRDDNTREQEERTKPWRPSKLLPDPPKEDGYEFRWVRTKIRSELDNRNVSKALRDGWEPCKLEDYPELQLIPDRDTSFEGNVEIAGMLLCKRSAELCQQVRDYYAEKSDRQRQAVEQNYKGTMVDARMPVVIENKTEVEFGRGRKG